MTLRKVLDAGLARASQADAAKVRARHLSDSELDELLLACIEFLSARTAGPSPSVEGWLVISGVPGMRRWLASKAGLHGSDGDRLRVLRTEIYDLLEERGWIVKGVGHNVPIHIAPPDVRRHDVLASEVITIGPRGAGYGDPTMIPDVERAAMELVVAEYTRDGWSLTDVSSEKLGWDMTATKEAETHRLEVKGVSGVNPTVLLTKNEHAHAVDDRDWRLAVVTQALTNPTLTVFEPHEVIPNSTPHVYRVRLNRTIGI